MAAGATTVMRLRAGGGSCGARAPPGRTEAEEEWGGSLLVA